MSEANAIEFDGLGFSYGPKGPPILQGYSGVVPRGSVLAILGPNGRGKTTLLKLLLGTLSPGEGSVLLHGQAAFVPQLFQVSFPYRVIDMVLMGRARKVKLFATPSRADVDAAMQALERLQIADIAERPFDELSGGQRQLVIFARALASGAEILVLDEPTSALDLKNQSVVLGWISRLSRSDGLTVVFTSHHPQHAQAVADQVLLMFGSEDYRFGSVDSVLDESHLLRLYGVPLRRITFEHEGKTVQALVPVLNAAADSARLSEEPRGSHVG